jgi:hypothetical protein
MRQGISILTGIIVLFAAIPALAQTQFAVSQRVQVVSGPLNARTAPSASSTIYGTQPVGALGVLHQGPRLEGEREWWFVDYDSGPDGWSAAEYLTTSITSATSTNPQVASAATASQIDALYAQLRNILIVIQALMAEQKGAH